VVGASIWVDADACPNVIKEILFRAAERTGVCVTLVANQHCKSACAPFKCPRSMWRRGDVKRVAPGSVITAEFLSRPSDRKGGEALNPRGDSIRRYIRGFRDARFHDTMRSSAMSAVVRAAHAGDRNDCAGHRDTWLARRPTPDGGRSSQPVCSYTDRADAARRGRVYVFARVRTTGKGNFAGR